MGWLKFRTGGRKLPKNTKIRSVTIKGKGDNFTISIGLSKNLNDHKKEIPINNGITVGLDRGIKISMQLSDGTNFIFPEKEIKALENKIKKEQRKLSKKVKGSANYKKQQLKIKKLHNRIANIRLDFNHKSTTSIAKNHSLVCIEDLNLKNMSKSAKGSILNPGKNVKAKSGLNKSLLRMGLGMQEDMLKYKCPKFGSYLVKVNPKNSSRECSECGFISKSNRKTQCEFECIKCGHKENADLNASKVILARGQRVLACGDYGCDDKELKSSLKLKAGSKSSKEKDARTFELTPHFVVNS